MVSKKKSKKWIQELEEEKYSNLEQRWKSDFLIFILLCCVFNYKYIDMIPV